MKVSFFTHFKSITSAFFITGLLVPVFAYSATVEVNSKLDPDPAPSACTLRDALDTINNGANIANGCSGSGTFGDNDTITFHYNLSGSTVVLTGGQFYVTKDVSINGYGYPGYKITIDADNLSRIFTVSNSSLSLIGINLKNGSNNNTGGTGKGGCIYVTASGALNLNDVTLSDNTADLGGGVYLDSGSSMSLSGSSINKNHANGNGGGVYAYNSSVNLSDQSEIKINTSGNNGGGVYSSATKISIVDLSSVGRNVAENDGGGLYMTSSSINASPDLTVINSYLEWNWAKNYGGGVASINSNYMYFSNSVIRNNESENDGAGIYTDTHTAPSTVLNKIDLLYSIVNSNSTRQSGAGLAINGDTSVTITNSSLNDNTVMYVGSAIFQRGGEVIIRKSSVVGNDKDSIALIDGELYIRNSTLAANFGMTSSVGIKNSGGYVRLDSVTIGRNYGKSLLGESGFSGSIGKFLMKNTIFVAPCELIESATLSDFGGNFVQFDPNNCGDFLIEGQDPKLGVLQFNGGPTIGIPVPGFEQKTYTYALLGGSPAIDVGTPLVTARLPESCTGSTDQREILRTDGLCDIGAYEIDNEADKKEPSSCYVIKAANGKTIAFCF